jgi:hypothetical protein
VGVRVRQAPCLDDRQAAALSRGLDKGAYGEV